MILPLKEDLWVVDFVDLAGACFSDGVDVVSVEAVLVSSLMMMRCAHGDCCSLLFLCTIDVSYQVNQF